MVPLPEHLDYAPAESGLPWFMIKSHSLVITKTRTKNLTFVAAILIIFLLI